MGLNLRWLVNIALLVPPIAITLGILLGIDTRRSTQGQTPIFVDNGIKTTRYCQKAFGIHPETKGQEYTLNPNQWGWAKGDSGSLCMNVTSFNNRTYSTPNTAPEFSVSWQYPPGPPTAPVHAYPNIKVDGGDSIFPARLDNVSRIGLDVEWTYTIGDETEAEADTPTDKSKLASYAVNTNVAIDLFLDEDESRAGDSTKAAYEVMVWLAAFGPATHPIGLPEGPVATETVDGTEFFLYAGTNSLDQYVLTWVAADTTQRFHGDIKPLVDAILRLDKGMVNPPKLSDYLGYMSLGTEAYSSDTTVTFRVPELSIDITT